jgi:ABC-type xylose transport system permease subunit
VKLDLQPRARRLDLNTWAMAGVLVAMWTVLSLAPATSRVFLTQGNIANLLAQSAVLLIVAVGMTMVIVIRGIDLSVGAGVALFGVIAALAHKELGLPAPVAVIATIACGAAIGAWHGLWVAWIGVPAFVVTLAGFKAYRGGALVLSHAQSLTLDDGFGFLNDYLPVTATWLLVVGTALVAIASIARGAARRRGLDLPPVPAASLYGRIAACVAIAALVLAVYGERGLYVPTAIASAVAVNAAFVMRRTRFGRHLYAIGGNPEAARLSGIPVRRTTIAVYVILGVLAAIAALVSAARVGSVTPSNQGWMLELDAVTAVVVGGTSLAGGRGTIGGTVLGTLVFATLANGMSHLRIDSNWQLVFTGLVLLTASAIDAISKGRRS